MTNSKLKSYIAYPRIISLVTFSNQKFWSEPNNQTAWHKAAQGENEAFLNTWVWHQLATPKSRFLDISIIYIMSTHDIIHYEYTGFTE